MTLGSSPAGRGNRLESDWPENGSGVRVPLLPLRSLTNEINKVRVAPAHYKILAAANPRSSIGLEFLTTNQKVVGSNPTGDVRQDSSVGRACA